MSRCAPQERAWRNVLNLFLSAGSLASALVNARCALASELALTARTHIQKVNNMSLERFITAQSSPRSGFANALEELQAGRKTSHWIWYIFPQLASLGRSSTAKFYGVQDLVEACDYLREPGLRKNLFHVTEVVMEKLAQGIPLVDLMGGTVDAQKLVSCLTLFHGAALKFSDNDASVGLTDFIQTCRDVLQMAAHQGFTRCEATLAQIAGPLRGSEGA